MVVAPAVRKVRKLPICARPSIVLARVGVCVPTFALLLLVNSAFERGATCAFKAMRSATARAGAVGSTRTVDVGASVALVSARAVPIPV